MAVIMSAPLFCANHPIDLSIDWAPLSLLEWRGLFVRGIRTPLTQGYDYARAVAITSVYRPRWGVMRDAGGQVVGVVQMLVVALPGGRIPVVSLERGPVWFMSNPTRAHSIAFFEQLARHYPWGWFRMRRILPEIPAFQMRPDDLNALGYRGRPRFVPYQTMWVDAPETPLAARARLNKKWRNMLVRAERQTDVTIAHHTDISGAMPLIAAIAADQAARGYSGPDARFLMTLARTHTAGDGILATTAYMDGQLIAGALFLRHGTCATWQAGVVLPAARQKCANYRIVFEGLDTLFKSGIASVDLGGYNDQTVGIRHFKQGLGGQHVELLGAFA
jgi:hypothetical protein